MPTQTCRHIKANGIRCGSPALRGKPRCYFHDQTTTQRRLADQRRRAAQEVVLHPLNPGPHADQRDPQTALITEYFRQPAVELDFPTLEDRPSIQLALSTLLGALARNEIDSKRAGMLLYGLQVASSNAKNLQPDGDDDIVRDTVLDEAGDTLAPDTDPEPELSLTQQMFLKWQQEEMLQELERRQRRRHNRSKNEDSANSIQPNEEFTVRPVGEGVPAVINS